MLRLPFTDLFQLIGEVDVSHSHTQGLQEHCEDQNQHAGLPGTGGPHGALHHGHDPVKV